MSMNFDPYFKWLGIPASEQPPNHYRLLGIPNLVDDADVIENAADQRMSHVRNFGNGQHADASQRLLNEISAAKVTLMNAERKLEYDAKLQSEVKLMGPHATRPTPPVSAKPPARLSKKPSQSSLPVWLIATVAGVGLAGMLVVATAILLFVWSDQSEPIAREEAAFPPIAATPTGNDNTADRNAIETPVVTSVPSDTDHALPDRHDDGARPDTTINTTNNESDDDKNLIALGDGEDGATQLVSAPVEKAGVPDADARKAAEQKVDTVFGDQLAKAKTDAEKRAIAQEMIRVAARTEQLPIRFVLYEQAIDIAKGIGDAQVAFDAVNRLDETFDGDALRLKASVLHGITTTLGRGKEHAAMATYFVSTIDAAIADNRFDIAQPLTEVALQSAIKSADIELRKQAVQRVKDVEALAETFKVVEKALATLRTKPTDAEANLVAGKYYCFVRDEWREGLTFLALASDAQLKALAEEELKASPDAMKLGNGWWAVSEELPELQSRRAQVRAAQHYRRVLPTLTGFDKVTVQKRLSDLPDTAPLEVAPRENIVDLIALSDPARHGEKGRWQKVDGTLVVANLQDASFLSPPYQPPKEYDLQVSVTRTHNGPTGASDTHVRIPHGDKCHTFGIRAAKDGATAFSFWGDKPFGAPPMGVTLRPGIALGTKHTLLFRVRDSGISVSVDGKALFTIDDYSILKNSDDGIGIGSYQNQTVFHEAIVREINVPSASVARPQRDIGLFNGRDLTGWVYMPIAYTKSKTNTTWFANPKEGTLVSTGGDDSNDLGTADTYADFRLSLQWRFRPGGPVGPNGSGIVVRASGMDGKRHNPRGVEIDLRPNFDVNNDIGTGCLLAYATPLKNHKNKANGEDKRQLGWLRAPVLKQDDGWNDCVITCEGDRLIVEMNGVEVNRAWGLEIPKGSIVLRNQKTAVEFRNIRLVDLSP